MFALHPSDLRIDGAVNCPLFACPGGWTPAATAVTTGPAADSHRRRAGGGGCSPLSSGWGGCQHPAGFAAPSPAAKRGRSHLVHAFGFVLVFFFTGAAKAGTAPKRQMSVGKPRAIPVANAVRALLPGTSPPVLPHPRCHLRGPARLSEPFGRLLLSPVPPPRNISLSGAFSQE